MLEKIITVIADVLDASPDLITPDTHRDTCASWDSLAHLQIIAELEDRLGVTIPFEAVSQIHCVRDFEKFIQ
jgi:acyl carrier protein